MSMKNPLTPAGIEPATKDGSVMLFSLPLCGHNPSAVHISSYHHIYVNNSEFVCSQALFVWRDINHLKPCVNICTSNCNGDKICVVPHCEFKPFS